MEAIDFKALRRNLFGIQTTKGVCRSLFGEVDHEEVKRDLEREFKHTLQQKSKLWNFDFDKYTPRDDTHGLQWKLDISTASDYTVKLGNDLVSQRNTTLHKENFTKRTQKTSALKQSSAENKQTFITDFVQKVDTPQTADDETNIIEIINESPPRNITSLRSNTTIDNYVTATKLNIPDREEDNKVTTCSKRKRSSQLKIDDFMKKKKPRTNPELTRSLMSKVNNPISSRLRSSPAV